MALLLGSISNFNRTISVGSLFELSLMVASLCTWIAARIWGAADRRIWKTITTPHYSLSSVVRSVRTNVFTVFVFVFASVLATVVNVNFWGASGPTHTDVLTIEKKADGYNHAYHWLGVTTHGQSLNTVRLELPMELWRSLKIGDKLLLKYQEGALGFGVKLGIEPIPSDHEQQNQSD